MDVGTALDNLIQGNQMVALTILIALDLVLGMVEALKAKEPLTPGKLGKILQKVLPYVGGYLTIGTIGSQLQGWYGDTLQWIGTILAGGPFFESGADNIAKLLKIEVPIPIAKWILGRS